jgi:hypothetical protein
VPEPSTKINVLTLNENKVSACQNGDQSRSVVQPSIADVSREIVRKSHVLWGELVDEPHID